MVLAEMDFPDLFWTVLWLFFLFMFIWVFVALVSDIFRDHELSGWGKAVWGKYYGQWLMEACVLTYDFDDED